ncbi:MAG TPA: XF1762 family protein, partial [Gemmataceae bacterium]|nr:XF1762 family protein [Gemmataceae bacterium]
MEAVPLHLKEANQFVAQHHRHNLPTTGCKFAVGAALDGKLVGVAIAGTPVARRLDDGKTLEVLQVATDGTPNACNFLYSRCARIAR